MLFIDARQLGYMKDRVIRDFTADDIAKVADTFHAWQREEGDAQGSANAAEGKTPVAAYEDVAGFCKSATLADLQKHDFMLTPGRYVGAADVEDDGVPFADKMANLTEQLREQFDESDRLEAEIKRNLGGLGYDWKPDSYELEREMSP